MKRFIWTVCSNIWYRIWNFRNWIVWYLMDLENPLKSTVENCHSFLLSKIISFLCIITLQSFGTEHLFSVFWLTNSVRNRQYYLLTSIDPFSVIVYQYSAIITIKITQNWKIVELNTEHSVIRNRFSNKQSITWFSCLGSWNNLSISWIQAFWLLSSAISYPFKNSNRRLQRLEYKILVR